MALQAKQTTQQRLMLAPNVTLALEILRMPMLELQAFLEHQMEENPCLELEDAQENGEQQSEASEPESNGQEGAGEADFGEEWLSHWRTADEREEPDGEEGPEEGRFNQRTAKPQSLHDSLLLQLGCQPLSKEERRLGEAVIQRIDANGYLEGSLDELTDEIGVQLEQLEAVVKIIQRFDPPGVGARNLQECLLIQFEQQAVEAQHSPAEALAHQILTEHFQLFIQHRFLTIAKATGTSPEQVTEACERLKRLNPKPGCAYTGDLSPSVIPDLIIHHRENHYDVELHDQDIPRITVSRAYYRMLKDPRTPGDAKEFLANKFRQASWLIKAIDERNTTLLSVARCLISLQRDFLEHGPKAIKPLTQAQVAGLVGRHASTVSRAIAGKTMDTPYGVFRLEELFASGVSQSHAGRPTNGAAHADSPGEGQDDRISDERIKAELQRLIAEEEPRHPLSDAAIAKQLAQRDILVARRTIAKYRTALKVLPAHLRRRVI